MTSLNTRVLLVFLHAFTLIACSSNDATETPSDDNIVNEAVAPQELIGRDWTLETVRDKQGNYSPLPLDATWRLRFDANGLVSGNALCNDGSGNWQANDTTLSIDSWIQTQFSCESSNFIPIGTDRIVSRLLNGEIMIPTVASGRLFISTGDNAQMVFSGRTLRADEQTVLVEQLVRTEGGARASNGNPVFGDLETPYVVYRDIASLTADFAMLPPEEIPWPELPTIDFTNSIVVGAYLPLDFAISSDIVIRNARVADTGLEIEVAHFGPNVPDEVPTDNCGADAALSAPWTLVRIESVVEPIIFAEMNRAFCSGVPTRDP